MSLSFVREGRPSLNAGGLSPPHASDAATSGVGALAVGMRIFLTHVVAFATGISSLFLAF